MNWALFQTKKPLIVSEATVTTDRKRYFNHLLSHLRSKVNEIGARNRESRNEKGKKEKAEVTASYFSGDGAPISPHL